MAVVVFVGYELGLFGLCIDKPPQTHRERTSFSLHKQNKPKANATPIPLTTFHLPPLTHTLRDNLALSILRKPAGGYVEALQTLVGRLKAKPRGSRV